MISRRRAMIRNSWLSSLRAGCKRVMVLASSSTYQSDAWSSTGASSTRQRLLPVVHQSLNGSFSMNKSSSQWYGHYGMQQQFNRTCIKSCYSLTNQHVTPFEKRRFPLEGAIFDDWLILPRHKITFPHTQNNKHKPISYLFLQYSSRTNNNTQVKSS